MKIPNELTISLENLIIELSNNGQSENASFFIDKLVKLKDINLSLKNKIIIMEELSRCRAIAQYANFSYYEESILGDVINMINSQLKAL
ncbi:hypothetical protein F6Q07_10155 [Pectobacterium parmentieri]|uniref:Uncharacterized protein n=1 Tax=Pectobacterium parmentieri TaxID=1905730 RepID=A0A8B3FG68_PECPM|nr:hypothetical protein [Pectobacterium parmentieri]AOR61106.1 hypothetical protein A8F97_19750 [Pectobacterium parmentieri]AYH03414.1 hypothetical protein C5E26_22145 [Pectobacterium parmentieri]AYH12225.1 hypothetical protein C5E24_22400 [Pectobacterium parmentieri]AYH16501.1 hypothetical protein C5E23_21240 [Pectobacterium parmentieri]AYH29671.1 hypothetical protein C5E20_22490 [Pectobacterium parmentieri]